ncbi:heat shock protein Hsp20 [Stanieria cyanosphaera PCC 7437]|uniref:Heat shock protein Hsp20 n=1 Tax=Stanieria cyanosphaera (strain ATCC 29371 / PCC 7437) TaxID=111780 RepID=K9XSE9_STAC7|nr:Hsp20/alpha crystallin family protein [Stanieria cyanosphaera]AFZ34996.1 heat shock protein Hsp20 [Stanieria cyanosphaera PCC 7437]
MSIIRWQPFREIDSIQKEMNRLFDQLTPHFDGEKIGLGFVPPVELTEKEDTIHLKLEVPGMEAKDLDVEVTADSVTITGERKSETKIEGKGMTRSEFYYGQFRRVVPLPVRIDNQNVKAEYKDGILNLNLPKLEEEKHKVVKVNLG